MTAHPAGRSGPDTIIRRHTNTRRNGTVTQKKKIVYNMLFICIIVDYVCILTVLHESHGYRFIYYLPDIVLNKYYGHAYFKL